MTEQNRPTRGQFSIGMLFVLTTLAMLGIASFRWIRWEAAVALNAMGLLALQLFVRRTHPILSQLVAGLGFATFYAFFVWPDRNTNAGPALGTGFGTGTRVFVDFCVVVYFILMAVDVARKLSDRHE